MKMHTKNKSKPDAYPGIRKLKKRNRMNCRNHFQKENNTGNNINGFPLKPSASIWKTEVSEWFTTKLNRMYTNMENIFDAEEPEENNFQSNHKTIHKDMFVEKRVMEWQIVTTSGVAVFKSSEIRVIPVIEKIDSFFNKLRKKIKLTLLLDYVLNVESFGPKAHKANLKANTEKFTIKARSCGGKLINKTIDWLDLKPINNIRLKTKNKWFSSVNRMIDKKIFKRKEFMITLPPVLHRVFINFRMLREQLE